jgi:hypothetical protein
MTSPAAKVLIAPIRFYQRFITPYTPASCRYYPTCSAYAVTALRTRGAVVGTALTIWRLLRCNPWSDGGIDHVPVTGWRTRPPADEPVGLEHSHDDHEDDRELPDSAAGPGERDDTVGSSHGDDGGSSGRDTADGSPSTAAPAHPAAANDLDAPQSAAAEPMTGRSAA